VKWRRCAQKTAERVFVSARNRIDRMGGLRTFMTEQKERASTWEDDTTQQQESQEDEGRERYERREEEEEEEEDVGDEFTMEIMLKMAGVDEKLIGWDREENNFIKK
jgi:Swi5-dependent recombination DNA repair protein 1